MMVPLDSVGVAVTFQTEGGAPCNRKIEVQYGHEVESRDKLTMLKLNDLLWACGLGGVQLFSSCTPFPFARR